MKARPPCQKARPECDFDGVSMDTDHFLMFDSAGGEPWPRYYLPSLPDVLLAHFSVFLRLTSALAGEENEKFFFLKVVGIDSGND